MTRCTSWWGQMCRLPASIYFIRNLWMCLISLQDFECAKDTWNHFREAFPVTFRVDIIQGHPFWNFTRLQHFVSYPSVEKTPQRGIIYNSVSPILSLFFWSIIWARNPWNPSWLWLIMNSLTNEKEMSLPWVVYGISRCVSKYPRLRLTSFYTTPPFLKTNN